MRAKVVARWWPRASFLAALVAVVLGSGTASAQGTFYEVDGTLNIGFSQTTRETFLADPMADPGDVPDETIGALFTEFRPGIALLTGSPRLTWRIGYQFSGNLTLDDDRVTSYSNQASVALAALTSKFTNLTISGAFAQGGTSYLLSQRPAEAGQPDFRAPGNPALLSLTLAQTLTWEVAQQLSLQQTLSANASAPEDDLDERNAAITGSLALDRSFARDSIGGEVRASLSWLRPLQADAMPYESLTTALLARWRREFNYQWSMVTGAGVEQVYTNTGSEPLAISPTASASLRYSYSDNLLAAIDASHGTATNLQVGSISLSDRISARGVYTFDPIALRVLSFSAGFLHNEPVGEASPLVAAGTGNALQGDAGFTTQITKGLLANARYSVAYQFGQSAGIGDTLVHIVLVGVTAFYTNTPEGKRARPGRGLRIDRGEIDGFPIVDTTQTP